MIINLWFGENVKERENLEWERLSKETRKKWNVMKNKQQIKKLNNWKKEKLAQNLSKKSLNS